MTKQPPAAELPTRRQAASEQRRRAILDAGLDVFATQGFAAARLEDVAAKAGVAKGTIYLFFKDKEDLFEQIVRGAVEPLLALLDRVVVEPDIPAHVLLPRIFAVFQTEVLGTQRKEIARLVINEGARFPRIAEFYHREVIAKVKAVIEMAMVRAHSRGELASEGLAKFPQLVMAPMLLALVWDGLFAKIEPLDVDGLLAAHREILLGGAKPARTAP